MHLKSTPISYGTDEEWHALRRQHVSGSEVAAALGISPWKTQYQLWAEKRGLVEPPNLDHLDRVLFGKLLEEPISRAVAQRTGWVVRKAEHYLSGLPDHPIGGTVDFHIDGHERGPGILEVKCTDWSLYKEWTENGPPLQYILQVMSYMALAGASWGTIAVLVGGNRLGLHEIEYRPSTVEMICNGVREFWDMVEGDNSPPPDFERDARVVAELYASVTEGKVIDLRGNQRATDVVWAYVAAQEAEQTAKKLKEASKAELLTLLGPSEVAMVDGYRVKAGLVAGKPDKILAAADIGTKITGRKPYRRVTVTEKTD